jgi:hypothetical protein
MILETFRPEFPSLKYGSLSQLTILQQGPWNRCTYPLYSMPEDSGAMSKSLTYPCCLDIVGVDQLEWLDRYDTFVDEESCFFFGRGGGRTSSG